MGGKQTKDTDPCRKSLGDLPLPSASPCLRDTSVSPWLNSRNCTIAMFMGGARRFERMSVNRPSRRLDGKLNYKDPDWLDPLEAHSCRKDRPIPLGYLRANKFWNCIRDGTMNLSVWPALHLDPRDTSLFAEEIRVIFDVL